MQSLDFNALDLNVRPLFQYTLVPLLYIMTSSGPPKRYFAPGPTEPLGGPDHTYIALILELQNPPDFPVCDFELFYANILLSP